jgi:hypothetical protein
MIDPVRFSIEDEARSLAASNAEADENLKEIWWFPHDEEIRLIEVDPTVPSSDEIAPYCFPPDPVEGIHFPSAIALIRPQEKALPLPDGWSGWDKAVQMYAGEKQ